MPPHCNVARQRPLRSSFASPYASRRRHGADKDTAFDPYSYTQGRWLDRDHDRRKARQLSFDFDALLDVAVKSSRGARRVVGCEKREGGFNRVFVVQLDNGANVIARLPTALAGPRRLTVMSEVATLKYVKKKTSLPVPNVLAWSAEPAAGPVGAEYIIMDAVPGVALKDVWSHMTELQQIDCVDALGKMAEELCKLDFPALGSLYLNTADRPKGVLPLDDEYCIGPHSAPQYWGCGVGKSGSFDVPEGSQGPWRDLTSYFFGLINIAKSSILNNKHAQLSIDDRLRLLDVNRKTLDLIKDTEAVQSTAQRIFLHPDFHTRNIFVAPDDPTNITGIIDWQSAAIEPAFVHAGETPDFAEELPFDKTLDADRTPEMNDAQAQAQQLGGVWAIHAFLSPKLKRADAQDPLLCQYLAAGGSGWLDDPVCLRSQLMDLSQKWADLGLPGESLYRPSQQDLDVLNVQLDERQSTQRLRMYLARVLGCETDGWVEMSRWEEVVPRYREQYQRFVESCVESRDEGESENDALEKAERLWPFDLR